MLSVKVVERRPIDAKQAAYVATTFGQQADTLATIEYRFDHAICIRVEDVPVRYDAINERQYVHARIGGPIYKEVMRLAEAARQRTTSPDAASPDTPMNLTIAAPDVLRAA